jgi:hypothetical protein
VYNGGEFGNEMEQIMTAVTLELDDKTVQTLRSMSRSHENDLPRLISEMLQNALASEPAANNGTAELDLIRQARQELPATTWRRFRLLTKKRREETISADEYDELLELGDTLEIHHAKRIEAAAQLAHIWKRDLKEIMRILGIRPRHV